MVIYITNTVMFRLWTMAAHCLKNTLWELFGRLIDTDLREE